MNVINRLKEYIKFKFEIGVILFLFIIDSEFAFHLMLFGKEGAESFLYFRELNKELCSNSKTKGLLNRND